MAKLSHDDLVFQIYNTVQSPEYWPKVLAAIAADLQSTHAFIAARANAETQPFAFIEHGFEAGHFEQYQKHFYSVDVWTKALTTQEPNQFYSSHEVFDDKEFVNSEIYNDFARPVKIRHSIGCLLDSQNGKNNRMLTELAFMRDDDIGQFDSDTRNRANSYLRHIEHSLSLAQQTQSLQSSVSSFNRLLELDECAAFVCTDNLVVYQANGFAEQLLQSRRLVQLLSSNQLSFKFSDHESQIIQLINELKLQQVDGRSASSCMLMGQRCYIAKVTPWLHTAMTPWGKETLPALLLRIYPRQERRKVSAAFLQANTDLTRSESELCALLCMGRSLAEIAEIRNVGIGTVRQQVKSCMQKTSCNSQAALVAFLMSLIMQLN